MEEILEVAIAAALKGGKILKKGFGKDLPYKTKGNTTEIISAFDLKSEQAIVRTIKKRYKNSSFIMEEGGTEIKESDEPLWIIDPLDGTTNFVRSIPLFVVSIAAAINNEVVVAVIYHPIHNELFTSIINKGTYLNGKKISTSSIKDLKKFIISTRFPTNPLYDQSTFAFLEQLFKKGIRVRDLGASALEMAYLSAGRIDGFFISRPKTWDIAAGKLLVEEAGGVVDFLHKEKSSIFEPRNLFSGSPSAYKTLKELYET